MGKLEREEIEKTFPFVMNAAQNLLSLLNVIESYNDESMKKTVIKLGEELENEIASWIAEYGAVMLNSGGTVGEYVQTLKPLMDVLRYFQELKAAVEKGEPTSKINGLPVETKTEIERILQNPPDSKRNYVLASNFLKKLARPKEESGVAIPDIKLSRYDGNTVTINSGYADEQEQSYLEAIAKFCFDGQMTQDGRPFLTLGQLYRALRGGGDQSPTKKQKEEMLSILNEMERPERKIDFDFKMPVKVNDEIEHTGGRRRILSFDEDKVKIRGQSDIAIVFDQTPYLVALTKEYKMFESMPQEFKRVKAEYWTVYLENGKTIKGLKRFCERKAPANVLKIEKVFKPAKLSNERLALRDAIQREIWRYMRAKGARPPQDYSNQINYKRLFTTCRIGEDTNQKENAKDFIFAVMEDLKRNDVIASWKEYKNKGDKKKSGIEFYVNPQNIMLGE